MANFHFVFLKLQQLAAGCRPNRVVPEALSLFYNNIKDYKFALTGREDEEAAAWHNGGCRVSLEDYSLSHCPLVTIPCHTDPRGQTKHTITYTCSKVETELQQEDIDIATWSMINECPICHTIETITQDLLQASEAPGTLLDDTTALGAAWQPPHALMVDMSTSQSVAGCRGPSDCRSIDTFPCEAHPSVGVLK